MKSPMFARAFVRAVAPGPGAAETGRRAGRLRFRRRLSP